MRNIIIKEYNLNIINLNSLLREVIELEIVNFIYSNNIKLDLKSIDTKRIFLHFVLQNVINHSNTEYYNIFTYDKNYTPNHISTLFECSMYNECKKLLESLIKVITNNFNVNIFPIEENVDIDKNLILSFKVFAESKKDKRIKNIKKFLQKNELNSLLNKLKNHNVSKFL